MFPLVSGFGRFLFAYQDHFGEVDNTEFFKQWVATRRDVTWDSWRIEHTPGSSYLTEKRIDLYTQSSFRSSMLDSSFVIVLPAGMADNNTALRTGLFWMFWIL